jgi:hypothetical protein
LNKNQIIGIILITIIIPSFIILLISVKWLDIIDFKTYVLAGVLFFSSLLITTNTLKDKNSESHFKRIFPRWFRKPDFKAEISKKKLYVKGQDIVTFQSRFIGKLKKGYFVNEISVPEPQDVNLFVPETLHVSADRKKVMSYCTETINNPNQNIENNIGNINGYRDSGFLSWQWHIPDNVYLGKYTVKMMVFNEKSKTPIDSKEDEFEIVNPFERVNFR